MKPLVIAHRGASGYLPEHTLEAKRLAHRMGADYLEQDVVATRDDELVVLHDIHLDRVSNVASVFPGRHRQDGRYYARDFDLAEIRTLQAWEREDAQGRVVYPGRHPGREGDFRLHTLAEELDFVAGLNEDSGRMAGVYPEIKRPAWHRQQGVDLAELVLDALWASPFGAPDAPVYLQCFDLAELRRISSEGKCPWPLVQLLGDNAWDESTTDYDAAQTAEGLAGIGLYAAAIGPWIRQLYTLDGFGAPVTTGLTERAHAAGLDVHAYTLRSDDLPPGFDTLGDLVRFCVNELAIDGLFTDFPDQVAAVIDSRDGKAAVHANLQDFF